MHNNIMQLRDYKTRKDVSLGKKMSKKKNTFLPPLKKYFGSATHYTQESPFHLV